MGRFRAAWRALGNSAVGSVSPPATPVNFIDLLAPMDQAFLAQPFVEGSGMYSFVLQPMDVAFLGQPFVPYRRSS